MRKMRIMTCPRWYYWSGADQKLNPDLGLLSPVLFPLYCCYHQSVEARYRSQNTKSSFPACVVLFLLRLTLVFPTMVFLVIEGRGEDFTLPCSQVGQLWHRSWQQPSGSSSPPHPTPLPQGKPRVLEREWANHSHMVTAALDSLYNAFFIHRR